MASGLLDEPEELAWGVSTSMFAHPTTNSINVVGKAIGGFVFAANMFSFVLVVSAALQLWRLQAHQHLRAVVAGFRPSDRASTAHANADIWIAASAGIISHFRADLRPAFSFCSCLPWWLSVRRGCARR